MNTLEFTRTGGTPKNEGLIISLYMFTDVHLCHVFQVNEKLASKLHGYKEAVTGRNMVDRVVYLEMELSEALDANDMYKLQLRRYSEPLFKPIPMLAVVLVKVYTVVSIKSRKSAIVCTISLKK